MYSFVAIDLTAHLCTYFDKKSYNSGTSILSYL